MGQFLNLFTSNSTAIFIICAGAGISLMTSKVPADATLAKEKVKSIILKRSWFLMVLGLLLYNWWAGDILHFYGGYMHIAAFLLFKPKSKLLVAAIMAIIGFHILLLLIPIWTSWDVSTFQYKDF